MKIAEHIGKALNIAENKVQNTLDLLNADATVPFIARYRKELTGNLDEIVLYEIQKRKKWFEELEKRKQSILKILNEQGVLTDDLQDKILQTYDAVTLEDIYLPYKKKRKTKAEIARKNGLEPLAKIIMAQRTTDLEYEAARFVSNTVPNIDDALQGARYIIAEWINENIWVRNFLRRVFERSATIFSRVIKDKEKDEKALKYRDYFQWEESLKRCPSHRLLAMKRAENEGFVKLKLQVDTDFIFDKLDDRFIKNNRETAVHIQKAITDAYKRLLEPSISTEIFNLFKEKADLTAIKVFSENLRQLLLAPPLGEKRVLAIDPGYRTGCKLVCLNPNGDLIHYDTIFPHPPQNKKQEAIAQLKYLVDKFEIEAIAIGNGTASRETETLVKSIEFNKSVSIFIVSESGASVYSASKIAREEFPDKDVTVRGAVSIGRRLQDPLAELVKIDPQSIGVGQYQHDVDINLLKAELDTVVESVVNLVGVNVNTASKYLLRYVSGIGEKLAENIVSYRIKNGAFKSRNELKNVKRLGGKAFEQSAGFLRIKNAVNPLDDSAVHPESYPVVQQMAKSAGVAVKELIGNKALLQQLDLQLFVNNKIGLPTLRDIVKELEKPGLDIRKKAREFSFDTNLKTIDDVRIGAVYPGIVNNVTNFGCFVDIGIKENGLIHISNMSDNFVSNPADIVKMHQQVQVKVLEVDVNRKRIGLKLL
jgi:uncharacterized protein